MGYRQAAALASVSFFLGMFARGLESARDVNSTEISCRSALHMHERRLQDFVHTIDRRRSSGWTRVLYHVLQLSARDQGASMIAAKLVAYAHAVCIGSYARSYGIGCCRADREVAQMG